MSIATMVPDRTVAQRMAALEHANEIRLGRAALKRDMAAGDVRAVDVLVHPPACARSMKVHDLLCAMPRVGEAKAVAILSRCRVSLNKQVGRLTAKQRAKLVGMLETHAAAGVVIPTGPRQKPRGTAADHHCGRCGLYMAQRRSKRLCGFCLEEDALGGERS